MSKLPNSGAVAISAFAANPSMTSETGIGWSFIQAWMRAVPPEVEIIAVMNERSRIAVREALEAAGAEERVSLIGIRMPRLLRFLENPTRTRFEYLVWWWMARKYLMRVQRERHISVAHHVTFATEMFPTPITVCADAYRVWGPVGSAGSKSVFRIQPTVPGTLRELWLQRVRDLVVTIPMLIFGRRTELTLGQNDAVTSRFLRYGINAETFPNVILRADLWPSIHAARAQGAVADNGTLRIVSVGHLIPRKRFELGICALADPQLRDAEYHIFGAPLPGTEEYLKDFAIRTGVAERVHFRGKLPREELLIEMASADVLLHPSGREGASGVVGEATAVGVPVVCFEETGASSVLEAAGTSGVAVPAAAAEPADLARAILRASRMPRTGSDIWGEERFESLTRELWARGTRSACADGNV